MKTGSKPQVGTRMLAVPAARALARSWRIEVVRPENWTAALADGRALVITSWHEALLPVLWQHRDQGVAAIISAAEDGQRLQAFTRSIGYRVIAGSSSRGGARALLAAVRALQDGVSVGFTPDGPRGPRRVLKPGVVLAAQRGNGLILPVHASAEPAWRVGSWDAMVVPKPFARVRIAYGSPFAVGLGAAARGEAEARVTAALEEVTRLSEWPDAAATLTG